MDEIVRHLLPSGTLTAILFFLLWSWFSKRLETSIDHENEEKLTNPEKIRIARSLRQETTMTLGWIAQALHMGTKTHLSHLLYWQGKQTKKKKNESSISRN